MYSHERVGLRGRLFRLYKFRSMVNNADQVGTSVTASGDTRITGIGKILRTTKLDELPQLFNVLKGD
ncbi:MAG: sugar transferase, partial [Candidatus Aminicenantes bacterium]|nr:sugar transferase [Candidatus Aminicenantes bacterium]NIQ72958.1 sugar transferase [Candidatus Aminicenantes bacterium]NIT28993.1 sugar transferase [Candidatus Aminicenantes bacterium]